MIDRFDHVYEKYGPMVLRRCQRLLGSEVIAMEAMQDTFVQFLSYGRGEEQAFSSLLYRIATNVCLNIIRSDARNPANRALPEVLLEIADRSELESKMVARNYITKLFSMSEESTAWMAVSFYHDGMTLQEIAKESGLSMSGVRKRLRKFGMNLRKLEEEI
ncbi:MAG TPA: sigma-70 family RNA polymerase sigma factor [Bdellovibrionales bacterium]|nr:MAG: hypothetical protein A2X97_12410 [Bdellovibrionales bacterium GWA1_52_35]HAR42800.1 sigma-70 family RNA polymerase sigma factor [Bdellovibrionales bacterium]HCM41649.1 sigma-70 family RNA polymerase sigma factor [Bdellovibrionales bacterium]